MFEDEWWEEYEDSDRVLSVVRYEEPAPMIILVNRNRRGPKGPSLDYVYSSETGKYTKRES